MKLPDSPTSRQRSGFSLVEMLVVIGIMLTLMALGVAVLTLVMGDQNQKRSEDTVRKVRAR